MKEWLDAEGFAEWLEQRVGWDAIERARYADEAFARRYLSWTTATPGAKTSFYTVSRFLTQHFYTVGEWEIPEELFADRNNHTQGYPPEVREEAVRRIGAGDKPIDIARDAGCSVDIIGKWARAAGVSRPALTEEEKQAAVERVLCGETGSAVADEIGWNRTSLYNYLRAAKSRKVAA